MEESGSSRKRADQSPGLVAAPKDFLIGPMFAATKQTGPREVEIGKRFYQIGGFHPLRPDFHPPALDVRHARAIFTLLSFRKPNENTQLIRFSFYEFCRRYARTNGGRYARAIKSIVADLVDSYIRITDLPTKVSRQYRLIERIQTESRPPRRKDSRLALSNQSEIFFNGCTLSPEFFGLLGEIAELQHLKLGVFTAIRAPLAQAIYLYIPSRAHHHTERNPFEITLTRLLEQVAYPALKHKSVRHKIFTQHTKTSRSIVQQLDRLETVKGVFRVRLAETADGSEWKLQAWVEKNQHQPKLLSGNSKLIAAWDASGRTRELLEKRLANAQPLNDYELDLLEKAAVKVKGNERCFVLAKAMLSPAEFTGLLAEAKGEEFEGRKAKKNPTARLIWRLKSAISGRNFAPLSRSQGLDS
ncbi:MAG: hypothetical protein P4N60_19725 [Verrucomicrobiae bacterium]|nr:hypothetical protein [Verrucomicrobiae bacterium]